MSFLDQVMRAVAAYPVTDARHRIWHSQAGRWVRRGWLSVEQEKAIQETYPLTTYRPAWPIRFGLFVFGWLGLTIGGGTFLAFTGLLQHANETGAAIYCLLMAGGALEVSIRSKRCYHAGLDQAFLYAALAAAGFLILETIVPDLFHLSAARLLPVTLLWLGLTLAAVARYAEAGATLAAFVVYLLTIASLLLLFSWGKMVLPLVMLAASGAIAWLARRPQHATPATYYYEKARHVAWGAALLTMYLSVNYLVVREGNALMSSRWLPYSVHPPLGLFFIFATAVLPLVYLWLGLRRADRLLLTLGFVTLAFSFYTLRYYRSVLPLPIAATLIGSFLLLVAAFGLRYLRPERHGLTSAPDKADDNEDDAANPFRRENFEALASAQLQAPIEVAADTQIEFGGGKYGGGGASGSY